VVSGAADADIAQEIWVTKPAGIATFGSSSYTITDTQGNTHVIRFSRPTKINIYIIANLLVNTNFPSGGQVAIQEIFANYINSLGQGNSVIVEPYLMAQLASVPGIDDAQLLIGTAPGPTLPDNITIAAFQEAFTQTDFIVVNTAPG